MGERLPHSEQGQEPGSREIPDSKGRAGGPGVDEVSVKLARVRTWLDSKGYEAALFTTQPGVAWVTAGLQDRVNRNEDPALVWAAIDHAAAHLITSNVEEPRLLAEEQIAQLPFQVHTIPWYSPGGLPAAAAELVRGARVATDGYGPGSACPGQLAALRIPLTEEEGDRLAVLGRDCADALQSQLRTWQPYERECDLAARIAAALEERQILPAVLLVAGSERRIRFRHPVPTRAVTGPTALAVIVGVRHGLNVACSRSVAAGSVPADLDQRHMAACAVEAAMIAATRPGQTWGSALETGKRAYRDAGYPDEWQLHWQGGPIGYLSREFDVVAGSETAASTVKAGTAYAWNPTVKGGKSEDTFIATAGGPHIVSRANDWPELAFETSTGPILRPAVLCV